MKETSNHQENELKYGVIYVRRNPQRVPWLESMTDAVEALASPLQIEWIEDDGQDGLLLTARRFNVGNLGQYATVSLHLNAYGEMGAQYLAVRRFFDALMGVMDDTQGDIVIDDDSVFGISGSTCEDSDSTQVCMDYCADEGFDAGPCVVSEPPAKRSKWKPKLQSRMYHRSILFNLRDISQGILQKTDEPEDRFEYLECKESLSVPSEAELLDRAETSEVEALERSQQEELAEIKRLIVNYIAKHPTDPEDMIRSLLRGKVIVGQPGRLLVNGDMKIVLPEFDEMEIKMPAMCRVLYILFMKLRSKGKAGIVLKNIDEYRGDLANIYSLVKPGAREDLVEQYISRLCDPWTESLNQTISKINRCIKNHITSRDMQQRYFITGKPGKEYGIAIEPELLTLPAAVTM